MIEGIIKLKLTNEDRSMLENNNIVEYEFYDPLLGTLDIQVSYCKECRAKIQPQYRQKNRERLNKRDRDYYYENREKMKEYHRQYSKENREIMNKSTNEFYKKHPEKLKAKNILNQAIQKGEITRPTQCACCGCSSTGIEGHHHDYSKPLDVVWLCRGCHIEEHNKIRVKD